MRNRGKNPGYFTRDLCFLDIRIPVLHIQAKKAHITVWGCPWPIRVLSELTILGPEPDPQDTKKPPIKIGGSLTIDLHIESESANIVIPLNYQRPNSHRLPDQLSFA